MLRLAKERCQTDTMHGDMKDVSTQFMIVSDVGGGWG